MFGLVLQAVGAVLLAHNPFSFESHLLPLLPATQRFPPAGASHPPKTAEASESTLFRPPPRPKSTKSRLGANERKAPPAFKPATKTDAGEDVEMSGGSSATAPSVKPKGQDAFRAMLNEKKA